MLLKALTSIVLLATTVAAAVAPPRIVTVPDALTPAACYNLGYDEGFNQCYNAIYTDASLDYGNSHGVGYSPEGAGVRKPTDYGPPHANCNAPLHIAQYNVGYVTGYAARYVNVLQIYRAAFIACGGTPPPVPSTISQTRRVQRRQMEIQKRHSDQW